MEINPARGGDDIGTVPVETGNSGLRAGKPEVLPQTPLNERHDVGVAVGSVVFKVNSTFK